MDHVHEYQTVIAARTAYETMRDEASAAVSAAMEAQQAANTLKAEIRQLQIQEALGEDVEAALATKQSELETAEALAASKSHESSIKTDAKATLNAQWKAAEAAARTHLKGVVSAAATEAVADMAEALEALQTASEEMRAVHAHARDNSILELGSNVVNRGYVAAGRLATRENREFLEYAQSLEAEVTL